MCIAAFNPSELPPAKLDTARAMIAALNEIFTGSLHELKVTYNDKSRLFTILNTSEMDQTSIATILAGTTYKIWRPELLEGRSLHGNLLVILQAIIPSYKAGHPTVAPSSGFTGALFSEADSSSDSTPSPKAVIPRLIEEKKKRDDLAIARQEKPVLCLDDPEGMLPTRIGNYKINLSLEAEHSPPTDSEILLRIMRIFWEATIKRENLKKV